MLKDNVENDVCVVRANGEQIWVVDRKTNNVILNKSHNKSQIILLLEEIEFLSAGICVHNV